MAADPLNWYEAYCTPLLIREVVNDMIKADVI